MTYTTGHHHALTQLGLGPTKQAGVADTIRATITGFSEQARAAAAKMTNRAPRMRGAAPTPSGYDPHTTATTLYRASETGAYPLAHRAYKGVVLPFHPVDNLVYMNGRWVTPDEGLKAFRQVNVREGLARQTARSKPTPDPIASRALEQTPGTLKVPSRATRILDFNLKRTTGAITPEAEKMLMRDIDLARMSQAAKMGSYGALRTLGCTKTAASPAQVRLLSTLGGATLGGAAGGGVAHATEDDENDESGLKRIAGGTALGALLGAGGGRLGYQKLLTHLRNKAHSDYGQAFTDYAHHQSRQLAHDIPHARRAIRKSRRNFLDAQDGPTVQHLEKLLQGGMARRTDIGINRALEGYPMTTRHIFGLPPGLRDDATRFNEIVRRYRGDIRHERALVKERDHLMFNNEIVLQGAVPSAAKDAINAQAFPRFHPELLKL